MSSAGPKAFLAAMACVSQAACATLANGTRQRVLIESTPPGLPVVVDDVNVGVTPVKPNLSRRRSHFVTVGASGGPQMSYSLTTRPSAWLIADLVFWPTIAFDLMTGAGMALKPGSVHALVPSTLAASPSPAVPVTVASGADSAAIVAPAHVAPPATYLGMSPGHRLRVLEAGQPQPTYVLLDSITDERLFWRPAAGNVGGMPSGSVPLSDLRSVQVRRAPDRTGTGASFVHYGSQLAWTIPMLAFARVGAQDRGFKAAAIASAAVIPIAFVVGAGHAENRWAPLEAVRSVSPLHVDDRIRVRQVGSSDIVSGRLVDIEARHLVVRAGADTFRVLRSNVQTVERAEGFDWRGRAMYGAAAGVMLGVLNSSGCACPRPQADMYLVPLSGALVGLLAAPALAPRRWRPVASW